MTGEILTTLTIDGDRLIYTGQIIAGATKHPITGSVAWLPTFGSVKRAIIDDVKRQISEYEKELEPVVTTVVLPEGGVFKDVLS